MADRKSFITLNLGSQRISAARFSADAKGALTLQEYRFSDLLADPAAESTRTSQTELALTELASSLKINKTPVRYTISGQNVFTRFVKLPPIGGKQVDEIVKFEAEQNVPFPLNEVIWDYQILNTDRSEDKEALLVAIKSDALHDVDDLIQANGFVTKGVDISPTALYNALRYNYGDSGLCTLLIDLGAKGANFIFMDGEKTFARTVTTGGNSLTSAIAKDLGVNFPLAEERKISEAFVSLGGAYEGHPDPQVEAMARVVRNVLGRLQTMIMQTITHYRQNGGNPPQMAYVSGGGAGLAYISEFFADKLRIPVEIFDPLRRVNLGPKVKADTLPTYAMGELVGLALREVGSCPMEVDLVPEVVGRARAMTARRPGIVMACLSVLAALGAGAYYYTRSAEITAAKLTTLEAEQTQLQKFNGQLKNIDVESKETTRQFEQFEGYLNNQAYWLSLFRSLNDSFAKDEYWLVQIEPMQGEKALTPELSTFARVEGGTSPGAGGGPGGAPKIPEPVQPPTTPGTTAAAATATPAKAQVDRIRISGLSRGEQQAIYDYTGKLAALPYFSVKDYAEKRNDYVIATGPAAGDAWAYPFNITLPLAIKLEQ